MTCRKWRAISTHCHENISSDMSSTNVVMKAFGLIFSVDPQHEQIRQYPDKNSIVKTTNKEKRPKSDNKKNPGARNVLSLCG